MKTAGLVSKAPEIVKQFANRSRPGKRAHVHVEGRDRFDAQIWPWKMVERITPGRRGLTSPSEAPAHRELRSRVRRPIGRIPRRGHRGHGGRDQTCSSSRARALHLQGAQAQHAGRLAPCAPGI